MNSKEKRTREINEENILTEIKLMTLSSMKSEEEQMDEIIKRADVKIVAIIVEKSIDNMHKLKKEIENIKKETKDPNNLIRIGLKLRKKIYQSMNL